MRIKWIGQSGYILSDGESEICIDPYLSDVVNKVAGRARLVTSPIVPKDLKSDIIICTHDHLDHLDTEAIVEMEKENKIFLCPSSCREHLKQLGVPKIKTLDAGETVTLGSFKITAVFADHTVPAVGIAVEVCGKRLYFTGDTYYNEKLEDMARHNLDYMFVCINGRLGNMNVQEAIRLTHAVKPKVGIPNHYGMFASNTENPRIYLDGVEHGFEMEFNKEYILEEIG